MSIATEEFRDINGYEGLYQISNLANIRSLDRYVNYFKGGKALKQGNKKSVTICKKTGYAFVVLYKNCKGKKILVHRLVAQAFPEICGKWFEGCEVDHIDTKRNNNLATNLKVCTSKENHLNPITREKYKKNGRFIKGQHAWNKGMKFPEKSGSNHFSAKKINQLNKNREFINQYETIKLASEKTGILRSSIDNCLANRSKTAGGFIWEYTKEVC